jgi:hypothetical protein
MTRSSSVKAASLLALAALVTAPAQTAPPAKPAPKKAPAKAAVPALEPKAIEILKAFGARLAAARAMSFTAVITYESINRQGLPLAYMTRSEVTLQRPDKLRVITPGDGPASEFYYDGKTMMAFAPAENLLAVADAPPTIDATLEAAYHSAAMYFPFADVIVADPYKDISEDLQLAYYIGQSGSVGGVVTDMVGYIDHGTFVQAWIGAEDKLPRRLRAIYVDDPLQLRHDLEISNWKLDSEVTPGAFAPSAASSAKRIKFAHPNPPPPPGAKPPAKSKPSKSQ